MKLYQIIMKVPDNFVPEEMQLTASSVATVEICSEGFIGPASFIECEETAPEPIPEEEIITEEQDVVIDNDAEEVESEDAAEPTEETEVESETTTEEPAEAQPSEEESSECEKEDKE